MSNPIISVDSLSKSYLVGHKTATQERYKSLRDDITRHVKTFGRKTLDMLKGRQIVQGDEVEEFWALRDVSFEIEQGDVLGVVGRNGAGKSTLLKILSRITEPTSGSVKLRGRVASLLEVGTGFHPELTGRENIFLNGAILGMTKAEIKRKFDEIVDFAGVERFLDTPVKKFSSGMYVRLAFAVAAHLDPEILIVDEVLAVGDAEFQRKCLGKMKDVATKGRTVIFVSHQLDALQSLCNRGILLESGKVTYASDAKDTVDYYTRKNVEVSEGVVDLRRHDGRWKGCEALITTVSITDELGNANTCVRMGENLHLQLRIRNSDLRNLQYVGIGINNQSGKRITSVTTEISSFRMPIGSKDLIVKCSLPSVSLVPGIYSASISVGESATCYADAISDAIVFIVAPSEAFGSFWTHSDSLGFIASLAKWTCETIE